MVTNNDQFNELDFLDDINAPSCKGPECPVCKNGPLNPSHGEYSSDESELTTFYQCDCLELVAIVAQVKTTRV